MKRFLIFVTLALMPALTLACSSENDLSKAARTVESAWRDSVRTALSEAFQEKVLRIGEYEMPVWWKIFGDKPADGRSLYISLHGGGQTDASENDGQWEN